MAKKKARRASKAVARKGTKKASKAKKKKNKKPTKKTASSRKKTVARRKATPVIKSPTAKTFSTVETVSLSVDQSMVISEKVRDCLRHLLNDPEANYSTNLRVVYGWKNANFAQLSSDLPRLFADDGMIIPAPLSEKALKRCDSIEDVCDVVLAAYE